MLRELQTFLLRQKKTKKKVCFHWDSDAFTHYPMGLVAVPPPLFPSLSRSSMTTSADWKKSIHHQVVTNAAFSSDGGALPSAVVLPYQSAALH